ncbi:MAG: CGNR zinc finger domain-containing protein [Candidatus Velthaea sp.]
MPTPELRFYLGSLALNFSATLGYRAGECVERIPTPEAFGTWLEAAELAPRTHPTAAEYRAALALREAIFSAGSAIASGARPSAAAVAAINAAARAGSAVVQLDPRSLEARPLAKHPVRAALAAIAADAIEVFSHERPRLGRCEGPTCGALMLSSARGAHRRWCSMNTCGNRAKVAAYRARQA